ncbi:MAG TPA: hypothetical protein VFP11_00105, partial [Candidatus Angelobacter sp.]|nr:hypothetical protein [Candidatus Angelobacter sp.]
SLQTATYPQPRLDLSAPDARASARKPASAQRSRIGSPLQAAMQSRNPEAFAALESMRLGAQVRLGATFPHWVAAPYRYAVPQS